MNNTYPHLYNFFAGYFHQDWPDDSPTPAGIIVRYIADVPDGEVRSTLMELRKLLATTDSDEKLAEILQQLGNFYHAPGAGLSYRDWLFQVSDLLEQTSD